MPIFAADPLFWISFKLHTGTGSIPMIGAATSYRALAETLRIAASSSDGHTAGLANTWQGDTANKALAAYRRHTDWLRQQAQHADMIAERCMTQARLYEAARAEMPHYVEIAANRTRSLALATASGTAVGMAAWALNEAEYAAMAALAVHAMVTYAAGTAQNAVFPPPAPAPHIAAPGAGGGGSPLNLLPGGGGSRAADFGRGSGDTGGGGSQGPDGQGPSSPRRAIPVAGGRLILAAQDHPTRAPARPALPRRRRRPVAAGRRTVCRERVNYHPVIRWPARKRWGRCRSTVRTGSSILPRSIRRCSEQHRGRAPWRA